MFFGQYEIIPVIAETRSFSKAAKILHLSQPAISSKVQAMEDYYGVKLFHRSAQGVTLTEAGKVVTAYAKRFLDLHRSMDEDLHQLLSINPTLVIGASCTAGNYAMPCSIRAFKTSYPQANIKLDIANTSITLEKLTNREVDVAVVEGEVNAPGVISHFLDNRRLVLILPAQERQRRDITLKELKLKPFVIREKGAAIHQVLHSAFEKHGFALSDFNIVSEMNSIHSVKAAVEGGMGVSIVPEIAIYNELQAGTLRSIPIRELPDLTVGINLAYRDNEEPSPVAQKFIRFITNPNKSGLCWNDSRTSLAQ